VILIAAVTVLVWVARRRRPYLLVGWLWYLITLAPVIGIVQFGVHGMADRFTYIPLIGISVMVAWGLPDVFAGSRACGRGLSFAAGLVIAALAFAAYLQIGIWRNSVSLFGRAVEVTSRNYVAHDCLANALDQMGDTQKAERHYREALRINPTYANARYNLASLLTRQERLAEAVKHLRAAIRSDPTWSTPHTDLGAILARQGNLREAASHLGTALEIDPNDHLAHDYLGVILFRHGNIDASVKHFSEAVRLQPDNPGYWRNLDRARALQ
jgi:Flp pilus assembly protein TadD